MSQMQISQRAKNTPLSPIRKLHTSATRAQENGVKILHLNIGQPDLPVPQIFYSTVRQLAEKNHEVPVSYAPSCGCRETISAWRKYYSDCGIDYTPEEIIVTTGGSEAIVFALLAVTDPGDEAIIFEPTYPNYISYCSMASVAIRPVGLDQENNYHLPSDEAIGRAITPRTRAIIVCNPSNPTGTLFTAEELQRIVRIAVAHKLYIIADETYREIIFDGQKFVSLMQFPEARQNIIMVDSVSKRFNLCGARIGCLASKNRELMVQVEKFAQARLSAPTLEQLAVVPLLRDSGQYALPIVQAFSQRRKVIMAGLDGIPGVTYSKPDGAFYTMVTLPVQDTEDFCRWLVEGFSDHGQTVMLAPGSGFYASPDLGRQQVRLAYVLDEQLLKRALEILAIGLKKYSEKS